MTSLSIQVSLGSATVECHSCGGSLSLPSADRDGLVLGVREFLARHSECAGLRLGRTP